jgi:hypothetical protein
MTNWSNMTDFESMFIEANRHAPFWTAIMFMIWVVLTVTFLPFGFNVAVLAGSFIAFVIGLMLVYMGLVSWGYLLIFIGSIILIVIIDALFARKET